MGAEIIDLAQRRDPVGPCASANRPSERDVRRALLASAIHDLVAGDMSWFQRVAIEGVEKFEVGDLIVAAEKMELAARFARTMDAELRDRAERNRKKRKRRAARQPAIGADKT